MCTPWRWGRSNERAVANARAAATELCRRRVERAEVELFLAAHAAAACRRSPPTAAEAAGGGPLACRP